MAVVAGVDSSTQSTKVELRDVSTGRLLGSGRAPHPPTTPPRSEQDPAAWWTAFEAAFFRSCEAAEVDRVDAVAVAGQQHGLVALDATGSVIRPAKLWNDTQSAPDAAWLIERLGGPERWAEACGSVPVSAFTIAKLSWLRRAEPASWERLDRVCLPHDWLTARLTGRLGGPLTTDRGDASGTGYWSAAEGAYRWDLLAVVDPERDWTSAVPEVLGPAETAGRWRDAVVGPGTGDNMAAALGLGLRPGDVAVSIGTSGTVFSVAEHPTADVAGHVAGFADATGRFLPLVCTLNATKVTDAAARLLGVDLDAFDALALASPPGAGGLTLLPYLDGERTPNRPDATGVLAGIRSDVSREHLARAAVEGVVCGLLDGLDALAAHVPTSGRLVLCGGGARSAAFRHLLAGLSGRPVTLVDLDESVAAGACVQAAAVLDGADPLEMRAAWAIPEREIGVPDVDAGAVRAAHAVVRDRSA